jgi:hypothetical protein
MTVIARAAVAFALLIGLAWASRISWRLPEAGASVLRVSARFRAEIEQRCRAATAAELEAQAAHMRQATICDNPRVAPYTLAIAVDGTDIRSGAVRGSGGAGEGTLYINEEFRVSPGLRRVTVRLERADTGGAADARSADTTATDDRRPVRRAIPPVVAMDTTLSLGSGGILLVTYDPEREVLAVRGGS